MHFGGSADRDEVVSARVVSERVLGSRIVTDAENDVVERRAVLSDDGNKDWPAESEGEELSG